MTQDYCLGPCIKAPEHYALLRHVLSLEPQGLALEFGVGKGESTRMIASHMEVIGFDSFQGLPEDWRPGFPAGAFAHRQPSISGASMVAGLFEDTLPDVDAYLWSTPPQTVGLVHIDCDLYSSTATVLRHIGHHLFPGAYLVFDEWHGFDGCEDHEQRAWRQFANCSQIGWRVIGHTFEQWAIQITQ